MAWKVLVSYLKDNQQVSPNQQVNPLDKRGSKILSFLNYDKSLIGSLESLEASASTTSTTSTSSSNGLSRTGSIRIGESPLHRGASLGSPAFRRKRRKTRRWESDFATFLSNFCTFSSVGYMLSERFNVQRAHFKISIFKSLQNI